MTRSQAYRLLDLKPGASETEIRKRYKVLALKVHPDINPDPKANEQFILLNQAMELLLSPEIPVYPGDMRTKSRKASAKETPEEQRVRMEQAKMRFEQQKRKKHNDNVRYFTQLTSGKRWRLFKWLMRVGCVLALTLILDSFLPFHVEKDKLMSYAKNDYNGIAFPKITTVNFAHIGSYFSEPRRGTWMTTYPEVQLEKTWILHTPVAFYSSDDYTVTQTRFDFHIGAVRWLVIPMLLIPLFTYLRQRKDLTFVFLYQLSCWGIGLLECYLLLTQQRLEHLFTLGFS